MKSYSLYIIDSQKKIKGIEMQIESPLVRLAILVTLLGGLNSCQRMGMVTSTNSADPKVRWLAGEPCAPPCWENVQPGITRSEEVGDLLKAVPSIDQTSLQVMKNPDIGFGGVAWKFSTTAPYWEGTISYFGDDDSVSTIKLIIPDLCLNEIIHTYGEPTYLLSPEAYKDLGVVNLLWRDQGFTYQAETKKPMVPITGDICDGMLNQFSVGTPLEKIPSIYLMGGLDDSVIPWTGYGSYSE